MFADNPFYGDDEDDDGEEGAAGPSNQPSLQVRFCAVFPFFLALLRATLGEHHVVCLYLHADTLLMNFVLFMRFLIAQPQVVYILCIAIVMYNLNWE